MVGADIRYSRSQLLNMRPHGQMVSTTYDWDIIDKIVPCNDISKGHDIKARITTRLSHYNTKVVGARNLITLPSAASLCEYNKVTHTTPSPQPLPKHRYLASVEPDPIHHDLTSKGNNSKHLPSIFGTNLQGFTLSKHHEMRGLISDKKYDIILLTETWLNKHSESQYKFDNYIQITCNRSELRTGGGGGVAMLVNSRYHVQTLEKFTSTTVLALWTLIKTEGLDHPMICGVLYHPPGLRKQQKEATIDHIYDTVQKLTSKHKSASLLLYGDFNDLNTSSLEQALGLTQIVDFPTRENAHLDKMYTNIPEYVKTRCSLSPPIGNSDHESVVLDSAFKKPVQYESITKRKVTPGAKIKISQQLEEQNWEAVLSAPDVDTKANTFQQIVTEIFHKNCPVKKCRKQTDKPFIETPLTLIQRRARQKAHRNKNKSVWKYLNSSEAAGESMSKTCASKYQQNYVRLEEVVGEHKITYQHHSNSKQNCYTHRQ